MSARMSTDIGLRACSGARKSGVPITNPSCVMRCASSPPGASSNRANPRSTNFTGPPVLGTMMLLGLMSRCTRPVWHACSRPSAACRIAAARLRHRERPVGRERFAREVGPVDELHHAVVVIPDMSGVKHFHHVGVLRHAGERLDLLLEPLDHDRVRQLLLADHLERDVPAHAEVSWALYTRGPFRPRRECPAGRTGPRPSIRRTRAFAISLI